MENYSLDAAPRAAKGRTMKLTKPLRALSRWLKFAMSRKTRNRSRAQREAWARRKQIKLVYADPPYQGGPAPAVPDPLAHLGAINGDKTIAPKDYGEDENFKDRDGISRVRKQEE